MGQFMWYTDNVVPDVANAAKEMLVHMSHPGLEHWKALERFIDYLKGKYTKGIINRKTKFMKSVMFCVLNYATDKETRNSVTGLVATHGGTLLTRSPKTQRTVTLSSTEAEYTELSSYAQ